MASPRRPPPLPVIKERTRALQQKLRQRAAQAALNTSSSSLSDQSQASFTVIHSTEPSIAPAADTASSTPSSSPLVSVDSAIARLRTYRDEQLLWHTAVDHCNRRIQQTAVQHWRLATQSQSHRHPLTLVTQFSQRLSARRQRAAVQRWTRAAQASRQYHQRHGHLTRFYTRHIQRFYFISWVAHTLHRKDREVDTLLAQSLNRSNLLRAVWRLWQQTTAVAAHHRVVEQRAQQHANAQLKELALAVWRAQGSLAVKEREKERSTASLGDRRSKRYYLQRWRHLPVFVRKDEQVAPQLTRQAERRLLLETWRAWKDESEWRHAAQLASDGVMRWRRHWALNGAWAVWERIVNGEREDEDRGMQADQWHSRQRLRYGVQQWRDSGQDAKAQRVKAERSRLDLKQSLQHWRSWAHQQRLMQTAQRHYDSTSSTQTMQWWRQQLQYSGDDRQMRERARTHEYESRMMSALVRWQQNVSQERHSRERIAVATTYQHVRLLRQGLSALSSNCHRRRAERHHTSCIRTHQLRSAVVLLSQHALYQRYCWQLHLRAKRFRYFHLLRQGWSGWHEARHKEAAEEERLFAERCGALVRDWTRQLFGAWLRLTSEQREARQREVVALMHWRGRLVVEAWQEWQIAVLDRADEQHRFRIADECSQRHSRRHALTDWLSYTRFKQQIRQAESEAVKVGQQQLQLLARRRAWQHMQLAFHTARAHRFDLNRADAHRNSRQLHHCLHTWQHCSSASAHHKHLRSVAATMHGQRLLLLAWQHWIAIQTERRRLLALHVRAKEWRKVREERRTWQAWGRWVHSRRAKRQREADMRQLRVERLQVEGVRQWVMVGLEWIQQREELEIEARRAQQKREQQQSQHREAQREAVARWVRRIAEHWRHRIAKNEEATWPLITHAQLTRWREAEKRRRQPQPLDNAASEGHTLSFTHMSAVAATAASLVQHLAPPDLPWSSSITPPNIVSRRTRVRTEPRRHVELLLDEPLAALPVPPFVLEASQLLSTSIPVHSHQSERSHSPQRRPPLQPPVPSDLSSPIVDDALLAALSAPSIPVPDLTAIETRLQFLAGLRSAYVHNKQELERLQTAVSPGTSLTVQGGGAVGEEAQHARCALLLHACLEFERQRMEWKREVQQWQTTLRHAQLSSG